MHTYIIHTYIHIRTCIHTSYIHTYMRTCIHTSYIHTYVHAYIYIHNTYIRTYTHTHIYIIHTYIHTYTHLHHTAPCYILPTFLGVYITIFSLHPSPACISKFLSPLFMFAVSVFLTLTPLPSCLDISFFRSVLSCPEDGGISFLRNSLPLSLYRLNRMSTTYRKE